MRIIWFVFASRLEPCVEDLMNGLADLCFLMFFIECHVLNVFLRHSRSVDNVRWRFIYKYFIIIHCYYCYLLPVSNDSKKYKNKNAKHDKIGIGNVCKPNGRDAMSSVLLTRGLASAVADFMRVYGRIVPCR